MKKALNLLNHFEIEFIKGLSPEEINDIMKGFSDTIKTLRQEKVALLAMLNGLYVGWKLDSELHFDEVAIENTLSKNGYSTLTPKRRKKK